MEATLIEETKYDSGISEGDTAIYSVGNRTFKAKFMAPLDHWEGVQSFKDYLNINFNDCTIIHEVESLKDNLDILAGAIATYKRFGPDPSDLVQCGVTRGFSLLSSSDADDSHLTFVFKEENNGNTTLVWEI